MNTVRQRLGLHTLLHTADALCHRLVRQQHELLNEFVGIFRGLKVGLHGLALLVDVEMQFLTVELHRTVLKAGGTQFLGKGIKFDKQFGILAFVGIFLRGRGRRFTRTIFYTIVL